MSSRILSLALCVCVSACSFGFATGPAPDAATAPTRPICTESAATAAVDGVAAFLSLVGSAVALSVASIEPYDGGPPTERGEEAERIMRITAGAGLVTTAAFMASAAYGAHKRQRCREAVADWTHRHAAATP